MNEETIRWILADTEIDPVSKVPTSAAVFMLYYGLELKHFLMNISDDIVTNFNPGIRDYKDTSLYLAGSAAQGFYLNTNDFLDARDIDVVSILRKDVRKECEFDKELFHKTKKDIVGENGNQEQCKGILKENSTLESPPLYLNVETWQDTYPGYVMLRKCRKEELPVQTSLSHRYVSSLQTTQSRAEYWNEIQSILADAFRSGLDEEWGSEMLIYEDVSTQGPAASSMFTNIFLDVQLNSDLVFALPYPGWPEIAKEWQDRESVSGWPSQDTKQDIIKSGCLIVPKGQLGSRVEEYEWRISFSFAELKLSRTLNRVQREIVHIMKAFFSDKKEHGYIGIEAKLDSYFVINILYTESEKLQSDAFSERNIAALVFLLIEKLESCIKEKKLPHYFIPTNNLLHRYTYDSVKLSKGEFKRGYGEENEMMDAHEYIDFARYAVLRLRYDILGQILNQSKYVQLTGSLRKAVFEPLVIEAKESAKVDGITYFETVLRLAKAHFFQLRFKEAFNYTDDAAKFYEVLKQQDISISGESKLELKKMQVLTSYQVGNIDSVKKMFEELEQGPQKSEVDKERLNDISPLVYSRTLLSYKMKYSTEDDEVVVKSKKMLTELIDLTEGFQRCVIYFDLLNLYMKTGRLVEAGGILDQIKPNLSLRDTKDETIETPMCEDTALHGEEMKQTVQETVSTDEDKNGGELNTDKSVDDMDIEIKDDKSSIASDKDVCMDTSDKETTEVIYDRTSIGVSDQMNCQETIVSPTDDCNADSKSDRSNDINDRREKLNLFYHQDLLNQYALSEAYKELGLQDLADRVYQKLLRKIQDRQKVDNTVTIDALKHDYEFYVSLNAEDPIDDGWEDPFKHFRDHVVYSYADRYILDDTLKALVEKYGVVKLTLEDAYYHFCIQMNNNKDKSSNVVSLIERIKDQDLVALHYERMGDMENAKDAEFYARIDRDGGSKSVANTLKLWIENLMEAARKYEPRNVYLDSVFA